MYACGCGLACGEFCLQEEGLVFGFVEVAQGPEHAPHVDVVCFEGLGEAIDAGLQLADGLVVEELHGAHEGVVLVGFALDPCAQGVGFPLGFGFEGCGFCAFEGGVFGGVGAKRDFESDQGAEHHILAGCDACACADGKRGTAASMFFGTGGMHACLGMERANFGEVFRGVEQGQPRIVLACTCDGGIGVFLEDHLHIEGHMLSKRTLGALGVEQGVGDFCAEACRLCVKVEEVEFCEPRCEGGFPDLHALADVLQVFFEVVGDGLLGPPVRKASFGFGDEEPSCGVLLCAKGEICLVPRVLCAFCAGAEFEPEIGFEFVFEVGVGCDSHAGCGIDGDALERSARSASRFLHAVFSCIACALIALLKNFAGERACVFDATDDRNIVVVRRWGCVAKRREEKRCKKEGYDPHEGAPRTRGMSTDCRHFCTLRGDRLRAKIKWFSELALRGHA